MESFINIELVKTWFYLFLLLTPFCGLVIYSILVRNLTKAKRLRFLLKTIFIVLVSALLLYSFGEKILSNLNIKLDALRVGAGILLFLTGLKLIDNKFDITDDNSKDLVIPLCIPVIIGPATTSALIVLSAERGLNSADFLAVILACMTLGVIFFIGNWLERIIGKNGIDILSKLNGLYMIIISAQLILVGLQNSFRVIPNFAIQ